MAYLKSISKGNSDFELKMLSTFISQTTAELKVISKHFAENDLDAVYSSIHKIKPSFHFIGAKKTEKLVLQIENILIQKKNVEKLKELLDSFSRSAEMDIEAVKTEMKKYPTN